MIKAAPKSMRAVPAVPPPPQGRILYCESDANVQAEQSQTFVKAGYLVERAIGRAAAEQALMKGGFDVVVLGHTLTKDDRHHLPYMAKKGNRKTQVLVLHASGKHPAVDIALDSRDGEKAILAAISALAQHRFGIAI